MPGSNAETYLGAPCKRNHVDSSGHTERYVSNFACLKCAPIEMELRRRRRGVPKRVLCHCKYCAKCLNREYQRNRRTIRRKLGKSA